ncbi:ankyrin repeat domain-containing protein [Burkholderia contaminans]|uniref:ankyrin repeat domain-containing protein n=1 Tax=Burkholderia contaminans TaxID=488447 RepID=UPI0015885FE1|nr:ankyrin repeat domain-containing protein [Burkholderia contaminans]
MNDNQTELNLNLLKAAEDGDVEAVKKSISEGADVRVANDIALRMASLHGNFQACDHLVYLGCDPQVVVDDKNIKEENKQWAVDFVNKRNFANKLTNDLAEPSSKAERLLSTINEDAEAPVKQSRSTRQKI